MPAFQCGGRGRPEPLLESPSSLPAVQLQLHMVESAIANAERDLEAGTPWMFEPKPPDSSRPAGFTPFRSRGTATLTRPGASRRLGSRDCPLPELDRSGALLGGAALRCGLPPI